MSETPATTPVPAPATTNPTRKEFFTKLLSVELTLAPDDGPNDTPANFATLVEAWVIMATLENSSAHWNPADTTQPEDGATEYNSFGPGNRYHVWNYASAEQGISAFLSTIGLPEYAPLRACLHNQTTSLAQNLAAIATSPWTGIASDPGLYDGVVGEPDVLVQGPGGWPFVAKVETPAPVASPTETEPEKVESAIDAEVTGVKEAEADLPVDHAAVKAKVAEIETHIAELKDLIG